MYIGKIVSHDLENVGLYFALQWVDILWVFLDIQVKLWGFKLPIIFFVDVTLKMTYTI